MQRLERRRQRHLDPSPFRRPEPCRRTDISAIGSSIGLASFPSGVLALRKSLRVAISSAPGGFLSGRCCAVGGVVVPCGCSGPSALGLSDSWRGPASRCPRRSACSGPRWRTCRRSRIRLPDPGMAPCPRRPCRRRLRPPGCRCWPVLPARAHRNREDAERDPRRVSLPLLEDLPFRLGNFASPLCCRTGAAAGGSVPARRMHPVVAALSAGHLLRWWSFGRCSSRESIRNALRLGGVRC